MGKPLIPLFLVIHNVRSIHNVGSLFRTADGMGVSKIFLTGYTPSPYDVFEKLRGEFKKTALGAERFVVWEKIKNIHRLIGNVKSRDFFIVSLEQSTKSIQLDHFFEKFKKTLTKKEGVVMILGNEVRGISEPILQKSGAVVEIPMRGRKESLNVGVAAGIALFEFQKGLGGL